MTAARVLDLTRSLRRAGRVATGVDRVEHAYLDRFLEGDAPAFGLLRTAFGYVLLDADGIRGFQRLLDGSEKWQGTDMLSRLPRRRDARLARAETSVRRLSIARCLPGGLRRMLSRHVPTGFDYYNTGHSNLTERVLQSVRLAGGNVHVLVHDVIPLEHPEWQRPGTVRPFREKMQRVGRLADRVIYNSQDTQDRTEAQMRGWGRVPPGIVSHLGTMIAKADPDDLPQGLPHRDPFFITVGTIEPRKNHALLLDLWAQLGPDAPGLMICGSRGWNNEAVFARLDALPPDGPVKEISGLSDAAITALVQTSAGMLFPSLAEGFGLPPVEAAARGARVLCNDLPSVREILGSNAHYSPVSNEKIWLDTIKCWANATHQAGETGAFQPPKWSEHFKTVLRLT